MIDFENPEVRETIGKVAAETGMNLKEILAEYKNYDENKQYVCFIKGEYKGKVGIIYPEPMNFSPVSFAPPYAKTVVLPNGDEIWCPNYDTELAKITQEEYERKITND